MPVNQNIQQFYRQAAARDFSRDFLFRVTSLKLQGVTELGDGDLVYAKTAALPGRAITNVAVPYMGLNINVPGAATYPGSESYPISFYLDANSNLRNYFENASRQLFDDQSSTGGYGTPGLDSYIILEQLNKELEVVDGGKYKLHGASIRSIENISYNIAEGTGNTVPIDVTFAYHFYTVEE